jgi:peroxiredoxin
MAITPSTMVQLGTLVQAFSLPDTVSGKEVSLQSLKGQMATVIMFICNHCPYVRHIRHELTQLGEYYIPKDVSFVAISSNDVERYPEDAPEKMKEIAEEWDFPFPYLYDATQEVAKAYQAACTPDLYIFDGNMKLVYRGQLDDSRPGNNVQVSGKDIRNALENILAGMPVNKNQKPSIGCNIKWKS